MELSLLEDSLFITIVLKLTALKWADLLFNFSVLFNFTEITFRRILIFFIKLLSTELGENSDIGKLFTNAMESLDEEEKDYYFSNSDST